MVGYLATKRKKTTSCSFLSKNFQNPTTTCKGQVNVLTITKVAPALLRTANPGGGGGGGSIYC